MPDLKIRGSKGHIEEIVYDSIFIAIFNAFRWKMIPNCTGRCMYLPGSQDSESRQFLDACGIDYATNELLVEYKVVFEKNRQKDPIM